MVVVPMRKILACSYYYFPSNNHPMLLIEQQSRGRSDHLLRRSLNSEKNDE